MTARKMLLATFGLFVVLLATAAPSYAQGRPRPARIGRRFDANKTFGLGLELGVPTGLNGKYFYDSSRAFDFGIGDAFGFNGHDGLHLYVDHLWHPVSLASTPDFELPFYVGVGGRFWEFGYDDANNTTAYAFGFRVPIGLALDFNNLPLDIFGQIVPVLDFYHDYAVHSVYLDFDISVGIRYWFN
jgi:hypothetical protein